MESVKKVAVLLSGCGVYDGSEIHEAVFILNALDEAGFAYECLSINANQAHTINHLKGEATNEQRNCLEESARIARGQIKDITTIDLNDYSALALPGGFGAAKNFSSIATEGAKATIKPEVKNLIESFNEHNKPIAFSCITPAFIPFIFKKDVTYTLGENSELSKSLDDTFDSKHVPCELEAYIYDAEHHIYSTPAYMYDNARISCVKKGIEGMIKAMCDTL